MSIKKALGKGLSALIPERNEADNSKDEKITHLSLDKISQNPNQPRKTFSPDKLRELIESIKENGIVQPIVVMPKLDKYEIVVGERRYRAAKEAGFADIPCIIKKGWTASRSLETALIENIQREDLNPIEEAMAYQYLIIEHSLTQERIAQKVGKSRPVIANALRLLSLPMEIRNDVAGNIISEGHARLLLSIEDEKTRNAIWADIKESFLSVRQTENRIKEFKDSGTVKPSVKKKTSSDMVHLENELTRALAVRVKLKVKSKGRGKIEINFNNDEELERLLEMLLYVEERKSRRQDLNESLL